MMSCKENRRSYRISLGQGTVAVQRDGREGAIKERTRINRDDLNVGLQVKDKGLKENAAGNDDGHEINKYW